MTWGLLAASLPRRRDAPSLPRIEALALLPDESPSRPEPREDLPNGPFPHARRAFAARPSLLPRDASVEAFIEWVEDQGLIDELGEDDLAELRISICLLAGWPRPEAPKRKRAAPTVGKPEEKPAPKVEPALLPEPTVGLEPEPEVGDIEPESAEIFSAPSRLAIQSERAAERFLEWLRLNGHVGEFRHEDLAALYQRHCEAEDVTPIGIPPLRAAMSRLGVEKRLLLEVQTSGRRRNRSRRYRPTVWIIEPLETVTGDIPWSDLPQKEAAA